MKLFITLLIIAILGNQVQCAINSDLVQGISDQIAGYNKPWYSGYLDISTTTHNFKSHYWFFEAQDVNPTEAPVLLWLNGGPGCSSLLGAIQENGPFMFYPGTAEFYQNKYSWNKKANVIYLESPGGVGFSTIGNNNSWTDEQTAQANLQSLVKFFQGFSEYQKLDFYIAGESYAGIYIPTLTTNILEYNKQVKSSQKINLKGILVGNGCTQTDQCNMKSAVDPYMYGMLATQGFFSLKQLQTFESKCGSFVNPDLTKLNSLQCTTVYYQQTIPVQKDLNVYNVIGLCFHQSSEDLSYGDQNCVQDDHGFSFPTAKWYEEARNFYYEFAARNPEYIREVTGEDSDNIQEIVQLREIFARRNLSDGENNNTIPACADAKGALQFFNTLEIKQALHVDTNINWNMCSGDIKYQRSTSGSYSLYPNIIDQGVRVMIYSGDVDAVVATQGTINWVTQLNKEQNYETLEPWRAWYTPGYYEEDNRQNAGQYWTSEGIAFTSFKGCGHQVPMDNPIAAYHMFNNFVERKSLPAY